MIRVRQLGRVLWYHRYKRHEADGLTARTRALGELFSNIMISIVGFGKRATQNRVVFELDLTPDLVSKALQLTDESKPFGSWKTSKFVVRGKTII